MKQQGVTTTQASAEDQFTAASLPLAIGRLLELNNYDVEYDVHVHGAQIDVVAKSKSDPFGAKMYIEATIEYVSTEKYGKDTTKFLLLTRKDPSGILLCISSKGFTAFVKERAQESGVRALSYSELFSLYEKFDPYITHILNSKEMQELSRSYEEPYFSDTKGKDFATKWLKYWRSYSPLEAKWLIVLGEYGTGKTSLTKIMQYRWLQEYRENPNSPIPIRIELRSFARQFDAAGLLHHFLDTNMLSHIPVQFVSHLIKTSRVILLLDGYDEMAQYLNPRERRACLSALADLSSQGAKGLVTSRPNYFNETEELTVFEALYTTIEQNRYHISQLDRSFVAEEKAIDNLVGNHILNRYERSLQDLTPEQTESLVKRSLFQDENGQRIVLSILRSLFREGIDGSRLALSGKPVIISYLLELIEELRSDSTNNDKKGYTESQIYRMIVDRLMLRDLRRSNLNPEVRRRALQRLALALSDKANAVADEGVFRSVIDDIFKTDLRRLQGDEKRHREDELFEDLRSSATLTRAQSVKRDGWVFSHNSLREYLVTESFLHGLMDKTPGPIRIPISSAMRTFVASLPTEDIDGIHRTMAELWPQRNSIYALGNYLSLIWDSLNKGGLNPHAALQSITGDKEEGAFALSSIGLSGIDFKKHFRNKPISLNLTGSDLSQIDLSTIDLRGSKFEGGVLDGVNFRDSDLSNVSFRNSLIFECDFSGTDLRGADFRGIDHDSNVMVMIGKMPSVFIGDGAIGYMRFAGAITDEVESYHIYRHHPKFPIVLKICERVTEQRNSQIRGLTQRGESRIDPPFARDFIERLVNSGMLVSDRNEIVSITPEGRAVLSKFLKSEIMPDVITRFLSERI